MDGTLERLRAHLRELLRDRQGRQKEVAGSLGRDARYLHKLVHGEVALRYERLAEVLDALGVDLGEFTCRALQYYPAAEQLLYPIARNAKPDRELRAMERALDELLTAPQETPTQPRRGRGGAADALVRDVLDRGLREQRRRLRVSHRYRTSAFAAAYLEALDDLRYRDSDLAARLAECVLVHFLPRLEAPLSERLAFACRALGVFASSRRLVGRYASAARALLAAFRVAHDRGLAKELATLYQRATYVATDQAWYPLAAELNKQALAIYAKEGDVIGIGKALVDCGLVELHWGHHEQVERAAVQALKTLPTGDEACRRNRLAALEMLAEVAEKRGAYDIAEAHLTQALSEWQDRQGSVWGSVLYAAGRLQKAKGDAWASEGLLWRAFETFERCGHMNVCLVAVDLAALLVHRGDRKRAAIVAARAEAVVRNSIDDSQLIRSAMSQVIRELVDGRSTIETLEQARRDIHTALLSTRATRRHPPARRRG